MFDWTIDAVLNTLDKVAVLETAQDPTIPTGEKALYIAGLKFPQPTSKGKARIKSAAKAVGYAAVKEVATIDLTGVTLADLTGKILRVTLNVKLSGSESGEYSRWDVHKGQPFYVEYFVATTPASVTALATALTAALNKGVTKSGKKYFNFTSAANVITITAIDEYQRILPDSRVELIASASDDFPVVLKTATVTTAGKEGFGTEWFITKNLRLPTVESNRFMGELQEQKPLAGTTYNQFTIRLEAERNIGAQAYVGGKGTSVTTHVFYVPASLSAAFEADLVEVLGADVLEVVPS